MFRSSLSVLGGCLVSVLVISSVGTVRGGDTDKPDSAVIQVTTSLGVEKRIDVATSVAFGEDKIFGGMFSQIRHANNISPRDPNDFFFFQTTESVCYRIPFRLVSKVRTEAKTHLLELKAGKSVSGKMCCLINGNDMASVEEMVVVSAPPAAKDKTKGLFDDKQTWQLAVEGPNELTLSVRNPRWAYQYYSNKFYEARVEETQNFYLLVQGEEHAAQLPDFAGVALEKGELSVKTKKGRESRGKLVVKDPERSQEVDRLVLFADAEDGLLVAIPPASRGWNLTRGD